VHAVFDGDRVFRVRKLTELEDAAEVFIDMMFPQTYEELLELIERGVKVFLLKNTRILKRFREENGVEKSDEADARLLGIIPRSCFKQLTAREICLLKLIGEYEMYVRWGKIIRQWTQIHPICCRNDFNPLTLASNGGTIYFFPSLPANSSVVTPIMTVLPNLNPSSRSLICP